jgi:type II secretory pathway pseudopilin PulG
MKRVPEAWSLLEILIVLALLLILAIWLLPTYTGRGMAPSGQNAQNARETPRSKCSAVNNLQQVRLSIRMSRPTGKNPFHLHCRRCDYRRRCCTAP